MHLKMTAFTLTAALIGVLILMSVRGAAADAMTLSVDGSVSGAEKKKVLPFETEFIFSAGYRRDELDWNIAGSTATTPMFCRSCPGKISRSPS